MSSPTINVSRVSTENDNVILAISDWYCEEEDRDMKAVKLLHGTKMTGHQWLQILCVINGFRSQDLAEMIGCSVTSIDSYRSGRGRPAPEIQSLMTKLLAMPADVRW